MGCPELGAEKKAGHADHIGCCICAGIDDVICIWHGRAQVKSHMPNFPLISVNGCGYER